MILIYEKYPPFACIYTKSFALIREKFNYFPYENELNGLSFLSISIPEKMQYQS